YRSLQAYRTGLPASSTTMVLSPDSEFFNFFGNSGKAVVPPGAAAALPALPSVPAVPDQIPASDTNTPTKVLPNGNVVDVAPTDAAPVDGGTAPAPAAGSTTPTTTAPAITAPGKITPGSTAT